MDPVARYESTARQALLALSNDDRRPKTVHLLRTSLRRLQAYLELAGEFHQAHVLSTCVSELSPLRTLHVFEQYLKDTGACRKDIDTIGRKIAKTTARLKRRRVGNRIVERLNSLHIPPSPSPPHWMQQQLRSAREAHAGALRDMIAEASICPRRRLLHALRLRLKSIRYQEEWASGGSRHDRHLLSLLKRAQTVLGDYEERVQFRKLEANLGRRARKRLKKDWRRARKRARLVPPQLVTVMHRLMRKAIPRQVVPSSSRAAYDSRRVSGR
jgi:hypothetical protein